MLGPKWIEEARPVQSVTVDVGFFVADTFYYGPDHAGTPANWEQLRDPLYQLKLERYGRYVLSSAVGSRVGELVKYYRDVLRLMGERQKIVGDEMYFWFRPLIFARGVFEMAFPWHDCWEDALSLFGALCSPDDGMLFQDKNQGWAVQAFAEGDHLFLWQGNVHADVDDLAIVTSRGALTRQVPGVRERVERLLPELTARVGRDLWTRR